MSAEVAGCEGPGPDPAVGGLIPAQVQRSGVIPGVSHVSGWQGVTPMNASQSTRWTAIGALPIQSSGYGARMSQVAPPSPRTDNPARTVLAVGLTLTSVLLLGMSGLLAPVIPALAGIAVAWGQRSGTRRALFLVCLAVCGLVVLLNLIVVGLVMSGMVGD